MRYLTELHLHSSTVSPCARVDAEGVVALYTAAGYTTLVLTEHYSARVFDPLEGSWEKMAEHYLSGYRALKQAARGKMHVLFGAEMRFLNNSNDYLVYGVDEEFILSHPALYRLTFREFLPIAEEHGLLVAQAHPFRNNMTVVAPKYLSAMEIFNGHHGHDARNDLAASFAKRYGLLPLSGSDFHYPDSAISGGILTDVPITSMEQLLTVLRDREYTVRCAGPAAERDEMQDFSAKDF